MAAEIILPRVDMDMEAGKITQWFVGEGESVVKGQPLFEIETDKAAMEIEAPASGVVRGRKGEIGEMYPVGAVVGWIYAPGEADVAPAANPATPAAPAASAPAAPAAALIPALAPVAAPPQGEGARATPKARALARERGLDVAAISGSGPLGRVQARDVAAAAPALPAVSAGGGLNHEWLARGAGAPIVFVHGFGADLNGWRPLFGHIETRHGALALDLPGHGGSPLAEAPSLEAFADALQAALAAEGVDHLHLVAHSLGAAVSAALAARSPGHVRSLTLISPAGLGPEINGAFVAGFLAARSEATLAPWLRQLASDEAALGSAMVKSTLRQRREGDLAASQGRVAEALFPDGAQAFDIRPALAAYPGPRRVVFGLEDRIVPHRHVHGLPGGVGVHLLRGVGHMPHFEARADVARIVEDNVAAGEARAAVGRPR